MRCAGTEWTRIMPNKKETEKSKPGLHQNSGLIIVHQKLHYFEKNAILLRCSKCAMTGHEACTC